jgi:hypothetical protein
MDSIVWTGTQFLYVVNSANTVWSAPAAGMPIRAFAAMPKLVEETRCIVSPGTHGFAPDVIFCHSPDNKIYELSADGSRMSVFATLPAPPKPVSDGALTFDSVGRFGYQLVAATGRSGTRKAHGGLVFTVSPSGAVERVGSYSVRGGADEVAIAPAGFGSVAGEALLTVDAGATGALVAMSPSGRARTIATFDDGPNPLVPIPKALTASRVPAPGIYVTNDGNGDIYFLPASQLEPYTGDLFVASEGLAHVWIVEPHGTGFAAIRVRTSLSGHHYGLEGAVFVA